MAEVDKLDKVAKVVKVAKVAKVAKVEEKTKMVDAAKKYSTILEDQSSEDPLKQWEDMCSNYLRNQMIKCNTARQ